MTAHIDNTSYAYDGGDAMDAPIPVVTDAEKRAARLTVLVAAKRGGWDAAEVLDALGLPLSERECGNGPGPQRGAERPSAGNLGATRGTCAHGGPFRFCAKGEA